MTRLIWVILFAVIIGLLVLFTLRTLQSGVKPVAHVMDLAAARGDLEERFPRASFEVRMTFPREGRRNLVVSVEPGRESSEPDAMLNIVVSVVEDEVNLADFDSLLVFFSDSLARAVRLKPE